MKQRGLGTGLKVQGVVTSTRELTEDESDSFEVKGLSPAFFGVFEVEGASSDFSGSFELDSLHLRASQSL